MKPGCCIERAGVQPVEYESASLSELIAQCTARASSYLLDALVQRFQPVVASMVSRTLRRYGACDTERVRDLSQDVFLKLLNPAFRLRERTHGRTDAEIIGLIRVTTANLVLDSLRASRQFIPIDQALEISHDDNLDLKVLVHEVDTALKKLLIPPNDVRDYRIFWFYHRDQLTAREISLLPGIGLTVKGVESALFRLTAQVKEALIGEKGISVKESFSE